MARGEFGLIQRYFDWPPRNRQTRLAVGDDAALLRAEPGFDTVVSTDTLLQGVHFDERLSPEDIGWKSLAVNLSDLAAMGAEPRGFTLALTIPEEDSRWLKGFSQGLKEMADASQIDLIGGDTTRGPLSISITVIGAVPEGRALRRAGAKVGDRIWVSGFLGRAAYALQLGPDAFDEDLQQLKQPMPRLQAGMALREIANAAIDISDGLSADLAHLLKASKAGATIWQKELPTASTMRFCEVDERLQCQLHGGDDYELVICMPPEADPNRVSTGVRWACIGEVQDELGLRLEGEEGTVKDLPAAAWNPFA